MDELKPCPFCGEQPDLPHGLGTQYEIECNCGMARSCVQITDLMTLEERESGWDAEEVCFAKQYVERARDEAIEAWNRRSALAATSPAHHIKAIMDAVRRQGSEMTNDEILERAGLAAPQPPKVLAWLHEENQRECISDMKKRDMIEHIAAGARSVELDEIYADAAYLFHRVHQGTLSPDDAAASVRKKIDSAMSRQQPIYQVRFKNAIKWMDFPKADWDLRFDDNVYVRRVVYGAKEHK